MKNKIVNVSAAIFWRKLSGHAPEILLALRPKFSIYGGYWEFPGGKIEEDETPSLALKREIKEELDVQITEFEPFENQDFIYPHANVLINFFIITKWEGSFVLNEHDGVAWQDINNINLSPLLPANSLVFSKLPTFQPNTKDKE